MFIHPDLLLSTQRQHERDLIEQAEKYRLLAAARRWRRACAGADPNTTAAARGRGRSPVERLHAGLLIVAALAGDGPAVIVFEDLHWADSESAALFERLADRRGRPHAPRA